MTSDASHPGPSSSARGEETGLPAWKIGDLPSPPHAGWQSWRLLLGPGILLAGASIGSGEWLFGPAVSAQYGATLLWLATLSILAQVFCNLEMMRYTLYCGEPMVVGYFRSRGGLRFWTIIYLILDFSSIWPFNASNAAVPLAAAILGHLPGAGSIHFLGMTFSESHLVMVLGYAIFLAAFIPLIFGGAIYRMLERVMAAKLVIVLGYLVIAAMLMVSPSNMLEVVKGFFSFGAVPIRADTIIAGRHFAIMDREGDDAYTLKGTMNGDEPVVTALVVKRAGGLTTYEIGAELPAELLERRERLVARAVRLSRKDGFFIETVEEGVALRASGRIAANGDWLPEELSVSDRKGEQQFVAVEKVPPAFHKKFTTLIDHKGIEPANVVGYWAAHGRLPSLDWAMVAGFAAIAGAGGLTNTLFSNYARDKGWGMGARAGAIPSAVGGRAIALSHVGTVFPNDEANRGRWRGWMRFIIRDQVGIWMICSFLGMALPCMLSLEFIRHAPVSGNRVAAMMADGMADRLPAYASIFWPLTLLIGFLIIAPGQIISGDQIARRWTDILWTCSRRTQRLGPNQVKYVYYGILFFYGVWGLVALTLFDPLQIVKISGVLMNIALGFTALHALFVNRTLLPPEVRPNWFMQIGTLACGGFFLGVSAIVFWNL